MKLKATDLCRTRAAGLAAATRGRSRQFADRADLLEQARSDDADISEGVEEYQRRHQVSQNQEERR
jgi:hypothetical protein